MKHTLPKLPYSYDALEPYIDAQTMEIHHTQHHQGYIDKLNAALDGEPKFQDKPLTALLRNLKNEDKPEIELAIRHHGGGHFNHSLFWEIMKPAGSNGEVNEPVDDLADKIAEDFGSFEDFKNNFSGIAASHFGSGWAWLAVNQDKNLEITATAKQDNPIMIGQTPILGLDVWEHAYYLNYQNKRPDYIKNWWALVDWLKVAENWKTYLEMKD